MLFNTFDFTFVFLPIVLIVYFILNKYCPVIVGRLFLIVSSLYFYTYYHMEFLLLITASITVNYILGIYIGKNKSKALLTIGIIFNIAVLGYFKYVDFFITNVNWITGSNYNLLYIALPLGISFITFQQIAYLVDIYRNEVPDTKLSSYILFITFFPQLIAGPIVKHKDVMDDIENAESKHFNTENFSKGLLVFLIGLTKKVVIADTIALYVSAGYTGYESLSFTEAWFVAVGYTIQLYFDFSGYSDMAIGLALMFNINLPMNFNSPLKSRNITEFWQRWHMTLNRFFTYYVYIPLGGSRKGEIITYVNLFIIFFISGFWHGAGWTFIIWGVMHGIASIILRLYKKYIPLQLPFVVSWFMTFIFVVVAFVYFRATSVEQGTTIIKKMFMIDLSSVKQFLLQPSQIFQGLNTYKILDVPLNTPWLVILIFVIALSLILFSRNSMQWMQKFKFNLFYIVYINALTIVILLTIYFIEKNSEFIYFNF